MMKKNYTSPEFDLVKFTVANEICIDSRNEGGGGGGDWGPGEGEPSGD